MDKEYKELLANIGLTDADVSRMFGYSSHGSFLRSSARERIRNGVKDLLKNSGG